jgi:predicted AlkP superfamily phosphohydrolase/phosphomutase
VGEYIRFAQDASADLFVVSDHGFGSVKSFFSINDWLEECDLAVQNRSYLLNVFSKIGFTKERMQDTLGKRPAAFTALPAFMQETIRRNLPDTAKTRRQLDVTKSGAYARGSAGIFVRDRKILATLGKRLREIKDIKSGEFIFEKVMNREDVLEGPFSYRAPDLFVQPSLGHEIRVGDSKLDWTADHRPEGIFIHYRPPGSTPSRVQRLIRPWDVAGLVLSTLGVPVPDYFDAIPEPSMLGPDP